MDRNMGGTIVNCKENRNGQSILSPAFNIVEKLHQRLQSCLKSQLRQPMKSEGFNAISSLKAERDSNSTWAVNLEKQLQAWRDNPDWKNQPPYIKVALTNGSLCNMNVKLEVGLPPDAIYNIVIDPENKRVFKNIKEVISRKVLVDDGLRQVVEIEQAALWKFLWWSGTISVHVFVDQNRKTHTVNFRQGKVGFMRRFEGCWRVEPLFVDEHCCPSWPRTLAEYESCTQGKGRVASLVTLDQLVQPVFAPPPISWYLRGITIKTTEMLINDLLVEADRLKGIADSSSFDEDLVTNQRGMGHQQNDLDGIKERWRRRRWARQRQALRR